MVLLRQHFEEVWLLDFEFSAHDGERPNVVCLVARELFSNRLLRLFRDELPASPPFDMGPRSLFVAYFSSAEWGCFLSLGWQLPKRVLDLYVEFRVLTNGLSLVGGRGLLGALLFFRIDSMLATEKDELRRLAMRGGPYTQRERIELLDYCQSDVDSLVRLLHRMLPSIDLPRALLRGRYMVAVARMESVGVPIDDATLRQFRAAWGQIKSTLIADIDSTYGVFEDGSFRQERFARWLVVNRIPWPRTENGKLALDDDTFRQQAKLYPSVAPLRELRFSLSELKMESLAVGADGRNRCLLSPFASRTGRNQPSNSKSIFGPSVWLRSLIKPTDGRAIAYIDWSQQELGIAAALSRDEAMLAAYRSGDPYLAFAKQAGAVPASATKSSHPSQRSQFKVCALAVQYGMSEFGLAGKLGGSLAAARNLLRQHRETYPRFWRWSQSQVDEGMLRGYMQTVFGWRLRTTSESNPRSLANFPMQANGAEMMRLACSLITEAGVNVCCPIHDAILIEATIDEIEAAVDTAQALMKEASGVVLGGFELASDVKIVRWPDRYCDEERGRRMWEIVCRLASEVGAHEASAVQYGAQLQFDAAQHKVDAVSDLPNIFY